MQIEPLEIVHPVCECWFLDNLPNNMPPHLFGISELFIRAWCFLLYGYACEIKCIAGSQTSVWWGFISLWKWWWPWDNAKCWENAVSFSMHLDSDAGPVEQPLKSKQRVKKGGRELYRGAAKLCIAKRNVYASRVTFARHFFSFLVEKSFPPQVSQ